MLTYRTLLLLSLTLLTIYSTAQTPGYIFTSNSPGIVLDPNQDKYTSSSTSGFISDDINESEIPYFPIPVWFEEPIADLRRGSDCNATDIVPDGNTDGFYMYFDGTNLIFRLRVGGYSPGAFGYNMLIDTDMKFGSTGPGADPNYMPQTTGTNGNPGFELEIVWEKNFEVAIYDVDGESTTPTLLHSYSESTNTQSSKALTTECGNPDYYMDFYVPMADMGITSSTPIRIIATTSTSPAPAIGGTKSDIYGIDDSQYPSIEEAWTKLALAQPNFTLTDIGSSGTGLGDVCTKAPSLSSPITAGETSVSGTWDASSAVTTATIYVYKNNILIGNTSAISGNGWSLTGITALIDGDVIYAKAMAIGESECQQSNEVNVSNCTSLNMPTKPTIDCVSLKGASGTKADGTTINIYHLTAAAINPDGTYTTNLVYFLNPETKWEWHSSQLQNSDVLSCGSFGGSNDVNPGSYYVTSTSNISGCESEISSSIICDGGWASTTDPVLDNNSVYNSTTSISGTCANGSTLRLFINGILKSTITGATTTFTFSNLELSNNDQINISAQLTGECVSNFVSLTVRCFTSVPVISTGSDGKIGSGSIISGISAEDASTVVTIYNASTSLGLGTASVQSDGSWTSNVVASTGTSYYAKQLTSCGTSDASASVQTLSANTLCPTITTPISEADFSVSGTLSSAVANTTVRLYLDDSEIGSVVTGTTSWTITLNSGYKLYAGGSLVATTQLDGVNIESSCSQNASIDCSAPTIPTVSTTSFTLCRNGSISTDISTIDGVIYTLSTTDGLTDKGTSIRGDGATLPISSYELETSIDIVVEAYNAGSIACEANSTTISIDINNISAGIIEPDQEIIYGGDPSEITVQTAAVSDGTLSYQWQKSDSPSSNFENIAEAINATYNPPANNIETTYYKRIASSDVNGVICTEESNVVTITTFSSLPIDLISFSAKQFNNHVLLNWSTASESNNNYFEIQRKNIDQKYVAIGHINSKSSNSNNTQNYTLIDNSPLNGDNYYRLKQVDFDGKFTYSTIRYINYNSISNIHIYPNPTKEEVFIQILNNKTKIVNVRISNIVGTILYDKDKVISNESLRIDTKQLSAGLYLIQLSMGAEITVKKLIISE